MRGPWAGVEARVLPAQSSRYTSIPFGHKMKMPIKNAVYDNAPKTRGTATHGWNSKRSLWHLWNVLSYHSPVLFFLLSGLCLYREECWMKGNSSGGMFHIWWYKWDWTINDVVSISHVAHDNHCSCLESKEMQSVGCACRISRGSGGRGPRPGAWFHRPGSFKNIYKSSVSITILTWFINP